tara:strand:- start:463 stop:1548 length:1086 start_codon:yes stop_codon:yes gene_type:complete
MIHLKNVENNMKSGFKKYKGSYKRSKSPFTDNDIDYNKRIGQPSRYKDRAKQDLKEANLARKNIAHMSRQSEHPAFGVFRRGMNVAGGYLLARDTVRSAKSIANLTKAGKIAKAGKVLAKGGLVSGVLPVVGGYLLAREAIRGVQRRKEKRSQERSEKAFGKGMKFKEDPYGSKDPRSPYQKYDSTYKRDSSPFSKKKDPKKTKKRILASTEWPRKKGGMEMTEYSKGDDIGTAIVYKKGLKKYTKELDLEHNPTGKYAQITRKGIRKLKKEGSYVSGRKMKRIKDDYLSGEYAKKMLKKRRKKKNKSPLKTELKNTRQQGRKRETRIDISMSGAIKQALEKNRLAEIKRRKQYGVKGIDY